MSLASLFDKRQASATRGIGYCLNGACHSHLKGTFQLNHRGRFFCLRCRTEGRLVLETSSVDKVGEPVTRVVLRFDYDPADDRYHQTAIVTMEGVAPRACYTVEDPLIRSEQRAFKVAETIIGSFARGESEIRRGERVIDFDNPGWAEQLEHHLGAVTV